MNHFVSARQSRWAAFAVFVVFGNLLGCKTFDYDAAKGITELGALTVAPGSELRTSSLLQSVRWDSLTRNCSSYPIFSSQCDVRIEKDSLITSYRYWNRNQSSRIDIVDYRGCVLSYRLNNDSSQRPISETYFSKPVWLAYAHEFLGAEGDSYRIDIGESQEAMVAYYKLLGVGLAPQYGWICEYGTVGMPTEQRIAAITLVRLRRHDLLRRLLSGLNLEGRVYAFDALVYLDCLGRMALASFDSTVLQEMRQLDTLRLAPSVRAGWKESYANQRRLLQMRLLNSSDSAALFSLRCSNQTLRTCGNAGSYKIYPVLVREVLSDSAIAEIPKNYQRLVDLDYFR